MMLVTLFTVFMLAPAIVLVLGTVLWSDDRRTLEALLLGAAMWYGGLFCISGIVYIYNTLTLISTYGK